MLTRIPSHHPQQYHKLGCASAAPLGKNIGLGGKWTNFGGFLVSANPTLWAWSTCEGLQSSVSWCRCLWRAAPPDCHWIQGGPSRGSLLQLLTCLQDFSEPLLWWWKLWISWVKCCEFTNLPSKEPPFHPEKLLGVGWGGEGVEARVTSGKRPLSHVWERGSWGLDLVNIFILFEVKEAVEGKANRMLG